MSLAVREEASGDSFTGTPMSGDSAFITAVHPNTTKAHHFNVTDVFDDITTSREEKGLLKPPDTSPQDPSFIAYLGSGIHSAFGWYADSYICLILTASVMTTLNFTCIKILSKTVSVFQIIAFRSFVSSICFVVMCRWKGVSLIEPRKTVPLFLLRGVMGAIAFIGAAFCAFKLPLSDSAFLSNSYPAVTAVLSWLFGMEQLGALSWIGVCGCFIGNALVAHPPFIFGGHEDWGPQRILGIISAGISNIFVGFSFILIRHIGKGVDSFVLPTYNHILSLLFTLPFMLSGFPQAISSEHSSTALLCYGGTTIIGICRQIAITRATQIGPPSKVTSLLMTNMLLTSTVGIVAMSERMSMISGFGAAIILVCVILVTAQKPNKKTEQYHLVSTTEEAAELELAEKPIIQT